MCHEKVSYIIEREIAKLKFEFIKSFVLFCFFFFKSSFLALILIYFHLKLSEKSSRLVTNYKSMM